MHALLTIVIEKSWILVQIRMCVDGQIRLTCKYISHDMKIFEQILQLKLFISLLPDSKLFSFFACLLLTLSSNAVWEDYTRMFFLKKTTYVDFKAQRKALYHNAVWEDYTIPFFSKKTTYVDFKAQRKALYH